MRQEAETKFEARVGGLNQQRVEADTSWTQKRMAEEIHPSNTDWVLRHRNRSCENQEHLESEQAMNNSGLDIDMEGDISGHVEKKN